MSSEMNSHRVTVTALLQKKKKAVQSDTINIIIKSVSPCTNIHYIFRFESHYQAKLLQ